MPDLFFPSYTKKILSALNAAGYEAYLVGGAVRDLLLGSHRMITISLPMLCLSRFWQFASNMIGKLLTN